jgi:hypothetical protein
MLIDPDQLANAGTAIGQCTEQLGTSLDSLQATVTTDNPWGSDEPGSIFGMAYVEVLGRALQVYGSHVQQLGMAAQGLYDWADSITQTEDGNARQFTALHDRLGG